MAMVFNRAAARVGKRSSARPRELRTALMFARESRVYEIRRARLHRDGSGSEGDEQWTFSYDWRRCHNTTSQGGIK